MIDRPRLYRQLDRWQDLRAIAIHAPTGYGKSSLVSRWIEVSALDPCSAWLSLEEGDREPRTFVQHLAAALERVIPGCQALVQPILEDRQGDMKRVLRKLFEAIGDQSISGALPGSREILLVLDDLHRVESQAVEDAILTILEQGPGNLHLVLLARWRTALPLARLCAQGQVLPLDSQDLRFSEQEVGEYLNKHGFEQTPELEVKQLQERTEGWVAALQLAIISQHGRGRMSDLIQNLRGDRSWLADYLVDEVLSQQSAELQRFLLQTSILEKFDAGLCAAVSGDEAAYARLEEIARLDLFLIPLDETGGWFRYHHLFQELLQHRLHASLEADAVAELHQRAGDWLAGADQLEAALSHYLAGKADDRALVSVEEQLRDGLLQEYYQARALLAMLPDNLMAQSPQLMLDRCRLAMLFSDERIKTYIQEAEQTLEKQQTRDPHAYQHQAEWLVLSAANMFVLGDFTAAAEFIRKAQDQQPNLDDFHLGTLHFLQMHQYSQSGLLAEMGHASEAALAAFVRAGFSPGSLAVRREMARWSMFAGRSEEANRRFRELIDDLKCSRLLFGDELAVAYLFAAENSYWQDDLEQAQAYQREFLELGVKLNDPQLIHTARYFGLMVGGCVHETSSDVQEFFNHLDEFYSPAIADMAVDYKTRSLIASGQCDFAWEIMQRSGIDRQSTFMDTRSHRRFILKSNTTIARGVDLADITPLLSSALSTARQRGYRYDELQLLTLLAWQQLKLDEQKEAAVTLSEAVRLALETGYVRVILDIPDLVAKLLALNIDLVDLSNDFTKAMQQTSDPIQLTDQEQSVLALLDAGKTYPQIAREMVISVNTVRTHVRKLYRKLEVSQRDHAVAKARMLGLLPLAENPSSDGR